MKKIISADHSGDTYTCSGIVNIQGLRDIFDSIEQNEHQGKFISTVGSYEGREIVEREECNLQCGYPGLDWREMIKVCVLNPDWKESINALREKLNILEGFSVFCDESGEEDTRLSIRNLGKGKFKVEGSFDQMEDHALIDILRRFTHCEGRL